MREFLRSLIRYEIIVTGSNEKAIPKMKAIVIPSPPLSRALRTALTGKDAVNSLYSKVGLFNACQSKALYKNPENSPTASYDVILAKVTV